MSACILCLCVCACLPEGVHQDFETLRVLGELEEPHYPDDGEEF